jgi:hypothetical protein
LRSRFTSVMSGHFKMVKGCTLVPCSCFCIASLRLYSHKAPRSSPHARRPATEHSKHQRYWDVSCEHGRLRTRSEVLMVKMSELVFWVVMPLGLVGRYQCFRET